MKNGTPPQNIVVKDNLASLISIRGSLTGVTNTNNINVTNYGSTFQLYDLATGSFDLHLKTTSPYYGTGVGAL